MKAVMYHYVRPEPDGYPHFRYLHIEDFKQQLDWLEETYGFISQDEFSHALATNTPVPGTILTFDDGFSDHYKHVFPELKRRGLWGIFYVPTGMYQTQELLDVHRIHALIGRYGGVDVLAALEPLIDGEMLEDRENAAFRANTYRFQDNDEATTRVKRILNYYISYRWRSSVLSELYQVLDGHNGNGFHDFYLTVEHLQEMAAAGMVIGSHSVTHPVISKLDVNAQRTEIEQSFAFLEENLSDTVETFCYPYGGFHNFTNDTQRLLKERGCRYAFNVEPRDIEVRDLSDFPMALPRYDCNMLRFGRASMGPTRPVESAPL